MGANFWFGFCISLGSLVGILEGTRGDEGAQHVPLLYQTWMPTAEGCGGVSADMGGNWTCLSSLGNREWGVGTENRILPLRG